MFKLFLCESFCNGETGTTRALVQPGVAFHVINVEHFYHGESGATKSLVQSSVALLQIAFPAKRI